MKFLICVAILCGLIFAEKEVEIDSLATNSLRKLGLFSSSSDNWIPPSLPNETEYIGAGCCCVMPLSGFLILKQILKKDASKESLQLIMYPKLNIGISYSSGIAYTGTELEHPFPGSEFPDPGALPEAIASWLYFNNRAELGIGYFVNPKWCLEINAAYMWARLNGRNPWFFPKENLEGNNWGPWGEHCYWEISTFSGAIGFSYHWDETKNRFIGGGIECNITEGFVHGEYTRALEYPKWELLEGDALRWGRGFGSFVNIGVARPMTKNISFNVSLIIRYSLSKEYKWELPTWAVLEKPISYSFTGIYLKIGLAYSLFKHQIKK
ncbi:MAG: hypothetical protein ACUVUH_00275 [bacterium]